MKSMRPQFLVLALAIFAFLGNVAVGQTPSPSEGKITALFCGKLYQGNGQVLEQVYLLVQNGKVLALRKDPPADISIIDATDKVVMPGIVAADTDLSQHQDSNYNITPDFVALQGFDFMTPQYRALAGGVTTAYLSPGRQRFISGQGSVVKLHGSDMVQRVLKEHACLRITMGEEANTAPAVFEPTAQPSADNPLLPARRQFPSARISQINELRRIFHQAQNSTDSMQGQGSSEDQYAVEPLRQTIKGDLPLRIGCKAAPDIRNANRFAQSLNADLVLENPVEVEQALSIHQGKPWKVVFRLPVRPGKQNPGGENRHQSAKRNRPDNCVLAANSGATVALVPASDEDIGDYLLSASLAIRLGMTPQQVLQSITLDAARILGVDDRVGSLEPGKDADFLVLSGEPFAVGTLVEDTFVDGVQAYHRESKSKVLAIRAQRIITCEGLDIEQGVILIADGKIKGIGKDMAIPHGARVIHIPDGVVVPGFVDSYCHLGLSGEGTAIPAGNAGQQVARVIQHDDPLMLQAAAAGLTTVMVSGLDSGLVSGRVAAIKTGAKSQEAMTLRSMAAIRFVYDAIDPNGIKSLAGAINKGKKYIEAWKSYEKKVADYKTGKLKKKPAPPKVDAETMKKDPVSGTWDIELENLPIPVPLKVKFDLQLEDSTVTGQIRIKVGDRPEQESPITQGSFEDGVLSIESKQERGSSSFTGSIEDNSISGDAKLGMGRRSMDATFTGTRQGAGEDGDEEEEEAGKDDSPKEPKVDENLEPIRALLEKRIPAIITCKRAPAIQAVVKWFEENKLPYILQQANDAVETPEILKGHTPNVLLLPGMVQHKGKQTVNSAAKFSDLGLRVGLVSGDTAGSQYLPMHAAMAVRYGMDPQEALKALTLYPAQMFGLADRIGSLKRGKDADLVVFNGNPLEMTSRVQLVVINGKVVVDKR